MTLELEGYQLVMLTLTIAGSLWGTAKAFLVVLRVRSKTVTMG